MATSGVILSDERRSPRQEFGRDRRRMDARGRALDVLIAVESGSRSQVALSDALEADPPLQGADRGLATELVYGSLRLAQRLDAWAAAASAQGLRGLDPATHAALRVGIHQLASLDRVPDFAAIDATLEAAKGRVPAGRLGYLHAVLRRLARETPWRAEAPPALPAWQLQRVAAWAERAGIEVDALQRALIAAPPVHLHVVPGARAGALAELAADGVQVARVGDIPGALQWLSGPFWQSRLYARRAAIAQDGASAAVVEWLAVGPGERVLDLCAGRGAKALFLAATGADVELCDVDGGKLDEAERLLATLGLRVTARRQGDAASMALDAAGYDAVLVDAPCSGLGTLRRRPEIAARRTMADVWRLAHLQGAILRNAATAVRPGGRMIYAVCTITEEEGEDVVDAFLADRPDFERDDAAHSADAAPSWLQPWRDPRGDLRSHPLAHGVDCFFAARLRRRV